MNVATTQLNSRKAIPLTISGVEQAKNRRLELGADGPIDVFEESADRRQSLPGQVMHDVHRIEDFAKSMKTHRKLRKALPLVVGASAIATAASAAVNGVESPLTLVAASTLLGSGLELCFDTQRPEWGGNSYYPGETDSREALKREGRPA